MEDAPIYLIPEDYDLTPLWEKIGALYVLEEISATEGIFACMDTYDWRLFTKGVYLSRKRDVYRLEDGTGEELIKGSGSRKKYPFWWDIEEGELQNALRAIVDVRALQEQFILNRMCTSFRLLNRDEKTVLRLSLVSSNVNREDGAQKSLLRILRLEPLRGYPNQLRRVCLLCEEAQLSIWDEKYSYVREAHSVFGIDPKATSSKFAPVLDRNACVNDVVRDICLRLRETMLQTLPGVLEDIDSEFLHDFRVAIRRTRSLLSLLKKYLPWDELEYYRIELKWLGKVTGPTRDLDVYLLAKEDFRKMLPPLLYPGLETFFTDLEVRRKKDIRLLRRHLASERFSEFTEKWEVFLRELPDTNSNPAGTKDCRKAAQKIIRKRFKRILRDGSHINAQSPDVKLHELRIEGKKFRYLLEFFRSLFQAEMVDRYLKQLKKLQNNLGDFNDLTVQREMLASHMTGLQPGEDSSIQTGAALGGLIVHLADQQKLVRKKFEKTFDTFASLENIQLLESVFEEEMDAVKQEDSE